MLESAFGSTPCANHGFITQTIECSDYILIQDLGCQNPGLFLGAVTLTVRKVLEAPSMTSRIYNLLFLGAEEGGQGGSETAKTAEIGVELMELCAHFLLLEKIVVCTPGRSSRGTGQ